MLRKEKREKEEKEEKEEKDRHLNLNAYLSRIWYVSRVITIHLWIADHINRQNDVEYFIT